MGIRTFTFNGESSDTYGIIINQNASFNAPERAGEMLSIPGRNGAFWQDYGRFENIEVTYHCAVGEGSKADFVDAMSDVRSWLCSPIGYCRLEDDYNPSEYRLAVYKSGLETDEPFLTGAEFDIVFECKPQRYLKSGETAISVTSGNTITNPTRFEAHPQLQVKGYGNIDINGIGVTLENKMMGDIIIANGATYSTSTFPYYQMQSENRLNVGDTICISSCVAKIQIIPKTTQSLKISSATITQIDDTSTVTDETSSASITKVASTLLEVTINVSNIITEYDTGNDYVLIRPRITVVATDSTQYNLTCVLNISFYTGQHANEVSFSTSGGTALASWLNEVSSTTFSDISADSTVSLLGNPTYIDTEIGELYKIVNGDVIGINSYGSIGNELPVLKSGANTITYDNTFTSVDIVPRWWQV